MDKDLLLRFVILNVVISYLTAFITARIISSKAFKKIDEYVADVVSVAKAHMLEIVNRLSKR